MKLMLILILFAVDLIFNSTFAQQNSNLTIVYDISVNKIKNSGGIEETYNGGTRSVFINGNKARIRLVSLMRMESTFFDYDAAALKQAVVVKESGTNKYRFNLSAAEWKDYNKKYAGITCDFQDDSTTIAGYNCKKAVINLLTGEKIIAYYTNNIPAINNLIEPVFGCIQGTVLQYEYSSKKGVVIFKASQVSRDIIAKDVFVIPSEGVETRKYSPGKNNDE